MIKLFLVMIVSIIGVWIFFHAYEKTKHFITKKSSYLILFTGLFISFVVIDFGILYECSLSWLYFTGLFILLIGIGRVISQLKSKTIRDHLTGLFTRTFFFNEYLPRETKRAKRSGNPISVILIDVDDFKLINDIYGHKKGDEVMKKLSRAIQRSVRGSDAVVRFGGDEILVVLPDTDKEGARVVLERIKRNLEKISEKSLPISISAGIAVWDDSKDFDYVIEKADKRMYKDKGDKGRINHRRL